MGTRGSIDRASAARGRSPGLLVLLAATLLLAACSSIIKQVEPGTRYGTAAALAEEAYPDGAGTALLATGRSFADALAAAPLSATLDGPILLTEPSTVPEDTLDALDGLGANEVVLLGGAAAISADVEAQLRNAGYDVVRRAGDDRFQTAAELARLAHPDGADTVLLATGADFADALAAAPLAATEGAPILLSGAEQLPAATARALEELNVTRVVVLGGAAAVGEVVEQQLTEAGYEVVRTAGADRFDTAARLAEQAFPDGAAVALLTTGQDFPDALAAAPLSAERDGPIMLVDGNRLPEATFEALERLGVEEVLLLGGTAAVGSSVEERLSDAGYDVTRLPE